MHCFLSHPVNCTFEFCYCNLKTKERGGGY